MKTTLCTLLLVFSGIANAELPSTIQYNDTAFKLCAQERISKLWFDIVDVGVYYQNCDNAENIFDNQSKLLRFSYLREVTGEQFSDGAIEYLQTNLNDETLNNCSSSYKGLNNAYKTVVSGDAYDLFVIKDIGIKLYLNGKHLHTMANTTCHIPYLNVWFGDDTMDSQFHDLAKKLKG